MKLENWVFVTGAPRSGTSFVGRMLSWPLSVDLIFEPTDPLVGMAGIDRRYIYLRPSSSDRQAYQPLLDRMFSYDFGYRSPAPRPSDGWLTRTRKRIIGPRGAVHLAVAKHNPFRRAAVIKDPDGALLTEYLHVRYGVRPVICLRHPTAFVASFLASAMPGDLQDLATQPALVEDHFGGDVSVLEVDSQDRVAAAATLWWALNRVLLDQCSRHPDWIVVVHEELCQQPLATFRHLFERLDLPWGARVERAIRRRTGAHNKPEARHWQDHHRDSAALFEWRRAMLMPKDRQRILDITRDVALRFYTEESFAADAPEPSARAALSMAAE